MSQKSWDLTEEQKERLNKRNAMQYLYEYNKYIGQQQEQFEKVMNFVNKLIMRLKDEARISEYIEFRARIKSARSAIVNDEVKALDDVFGMEIIATTDHELDTIYNELKKWMTTTKTKKHNKPNGYKANHYTMYFNSDKIHILGIADKDCEYVPIIEYQFKTFETLIKSSEGGTAEHSIYKGKNKQEIQQKYDKGEYDVFELPTMWVSKDGEMIMLTPEKTLKKMYPFLREKKIKEREIE